MYKEKVLQIISELIRSYSVEVIEKKYEDFSRAATRIASMCSPGYDYKTYILIYKKYNIIVTPSEIIFEDFKVLISKDEYDILKTKLAAYNFERSFHKLMNIPKMIRADKIKKLEQKTE